jgi:hypothetical protein
MNLGFTLKDAVHKIAVKFVPASLPNAVRPYNLRAAYKEEELDIHKIALKAAVYNITTSPKVIEEGLTAGIELMHYLAADGFRIKTPLFSLKIRLPGEYKGSEEQLLDGVFAVPRLTASSSFRNYLKEKVKLEFMGIDASRGIIAEARDEATGRVDEVMTRGNVLTINGKGLKIEGDDERQDEVGVFFQSEKSLIKASVVVVNNPKTLKVLVPAELKAGVSYALVVETQSSLGHGGSMLKRVRKLRSDFTLVAA